MTTENFNKIDMTKQRTPEQWAVLFRMVSDNMKNLSTGEYPLTDEEQKYYLPLIKKKVFADAEAEEAVAEDNKNTASDIDSEGY